MALLFSAHVCRYVSFMSGKSSLLLLLLVAVVEVSVVRGYHDPVSDNNTNLHCWPLNASLANDDTIDCRGLEVIWGEAPPSHIRHHEVIVLSVNVTALPSFLTPENFPGVNSSDLQQFCDNECEKDCLHVGPTDCCVWHANIRVCYNDLAQSCGADVVCGPWIGNGSFLATQTESECGSLRTYRQEIQLTELGSSTVTFHLEIGDVQIVIGANVDVDAPPEDNATTTTAVTVVVSVALGIPFSATMLIVFIILLRIYIRRRNLLHDDSWIIIYSDIHLDTGRRRPSSFSSIRWTRDDNVRGHTSISDQEAQKKQIFIETGIFEGRVVALKRFGSEDLSVGDVMHIKLVKEVMQVRKFDHPNVCKFIGATLHDIHPHMVIVTEYCPKGSLNDVLLNDAIPLNWNFRFTFAKDIARGMAYLHTHSLTHSRLTSSNCVIDDRWVTKITDYGVPLLRGLGADKTAVMDERRKLVQVYLAPEVRSHSFSKTTQPPADVYSYAILLSEIATRMDPFSEEMEMDTNGKPKITLKDLRDNECPCPQEYLELIHQCWEFSPQTRLTFEKAKKILRSISPYRKSPIDNMMIMLEKYSQNLEQLVEERTQELLAEKERATSLLYRMIPPAVADELKQGKTVAATSFSSATIFFSDIVGFTSLASSSTPMQIVNLLNKLYSEFDDILDLFDVYKVETIGDAYMVVSGVPRANGDSHAGEIAKMSLRLMATCRNFTIPHCPDKKLEIRAGIHSGSVCAGVVGTKMPRYCLFGDTVNTASRMESNSIAMHIQCSDTTYQLLCKLGGFTLETRGTIEVKGKGGMNTWWLKDYSKPHANVLCPSPASLQSSSVAAISIRESPKKSVAYLAHSDKHIPGGSSRPGIIKNWASSVGSNFDTKNAADSSRNRLSTAVAVSTPRGAGTTHISVTSSQIRPRSATMSSAVDRVKFLDVESAKSEVQLSRELAKYDLVSQDCASSCDNQALLPGTPIAEDCSSSRL